MMRVPNLLLSLVLLAIASPGLLGATTYHVDDDHPEACTCTYPDLNGGVGCGTPATPFRCVADGVKKTVAGDTVLVANGTYPQCFAIENNGTSGSKINIVSVNPAGALLTWSTSEPTCYQAHLPDDVRWPVAWRASHVVLNGFRITGGTASPGLPPHFGILVEGTATGNEIVAVSVYGSDTGVAIDSPGNTIRDSSLHDNAWAGLSVSGGTTTIERVESYGNGADGISLNSTSTGSTITDSKTHHNGRNGVTVESDHNVLTSLQSTYNATGIHLGGSYGTVSGGEIAHNSVNISIVDNTEPYASIIGNLISRVDVHHSVRYDGIKIDRVRLERVPDPTHGVKQTTIENCHIHHNQFSGIFENPYAQGTIIRNCEIDNNGGQKAFGHGLYLRGSEGLVQGNYVHHNSHYGIHLWAAPTGTSSRHYVVERNEVFANGSLLLGSQPKGGGIVLGGTPFERSCPPCPPGCTPCCQTCNGCSKSGLPEYVEVRYNVSHHNHGIGLNYLVGLDPGCGSGCGSLDHHNSIHHNTTFSNALELSLYSASGSHVVIKDNIFVGRPNVATLVATYNTNLPANGMDGNLYFRADSLATTPLVAWNRVTPQYSLNQMATTGVRQDSACGITDARDPAAVMDKRSVWGSGPLFVDSTTSLWASGPREHHGNFHLRPGSPAISGGVTCAQPDGGLDIDAEPVSDRLVQKYRRWPSSPRSHPTGRNCFKVGLGIGADYYLDSDNDGICDLFDCSPSDDRDATVCEGDAWEFSSDTCDPYDPDRFPFAEEICDGKDNDCDGALLPDGESDADQDGILSCNGDSGTADHDPAIYPGHLEWCDGKDNDMVDGMLTGEDIDQDRDSYPACDDCNDGDASMNPGHAEVCGDAKDNDCNPVTTDAC